MKLAIKLRTRLFLSISALITVALMGLVLGVFGVLQMAKTQEDLDTREYTAQAGGGMVTVVVTGKRELKSIEIKPECVDPEDVEMLQDLILAAVNEAIRSGEQAREEQMGKLAPGMGGML